MFLLCYRNHAGTGDKPHEVARRDCICTPFRDHIFHADSRCTTDVEGFPTHRQSRYVIPNHAVHLSTVPSMGPRDRTTLWNPNLCPVHGDAHPRESHFAHRYERTDNPVLGCNNL